jgi:hypothetical protein
MKIFLIMTAAVASLIFISPITRGQAPPEQNTPTVTAKINLSLEQRHTIREIIKDLKIESSSVDIRVGDTVSKSVSLYPMPADVAAKVPHIRALPEKNESGGIPPRARIRFNNRAGRQASMRWGSRIQRICVNA